MEPLVMSGRRSSRGSGRPYVLCEDLIKIYKTEDLEVVALRGLDLAVWRGEMVAIIGASGSGKTTLLNILAGLDTPTAGRAWVGERELLRMRGNELTTYRRQEVGLVWQQAERNLAPYLTAEENVDVPLVLAGWPRRKRAERVRELLEAVGLWERRRHRQAELSGGEQQRLALAVALATNPPLLLADEPTGELDTVSALAIFDLLRSLRDRYGTTIIVVTHDMGIAAKVDRVIAIRDGRTSTETVRQDGRGPEAAHEEYVVVDTAGRLQVPEQYREQLGIGQRARLSIEGDHIAIWPIAPDRARETGA